jgi:hypothetical protein
MKLLFLLVLLVAGFIGLGFYQGWFHLNTQSDAGKTDVTLTVDKDKLSADQQRAKEKVQDLAQQAKDKAAATADKSK